jgi:hypothetical protein
MRTAVVGSRTYPMRSSEFNQLKEDDLDAWAKQVGEGRRRVYSAVDSIAAAGNNLVSGGASGVDTWAEERATELGLDVVIFKAEWKKYGRGAGFRRNKTIVEYSDDLIAFWDLVSKGTEHTISYAIKLHKPIIVFNPTGQMIFAAGEDDWHDFEALKTQVKMEVPGDSQ